MTALRPHDRCHTLAANRITSAGMKLSSIKRKCPSCNRLNALCRYSRMDDAWHRCRYCGVIVPTTTMEVPCPPQSQTP